MRGGGWGRRLGGGGGEAELSQQGGSGQRLGSAALRWLAGSLGWAGRAARAPRCRKKGDEEEEGAEEPSVGGGSPEAGSGEEEEEEGDTDVVWMTDTSGA